MRSAVYMTLDHRPGGGRCEEWDVEHCPHCEGLIYRARRGAAYAFFTLRERVGRGGLVERREDQAAWCSDCHAHVCDSPACAQFCVPFVRMIELRLK